MTNGVVNPVFIDTNILVYANIARAPFHQEALDAIRTYRQAGAILWLSRQVLREYLATLTRPQNYTGPVPALTLTNQVRNFERRFRVAEDDSHITQNLLTLVEQVPVGGRQIHDANIVATMQAYGIRQLLTHNVADFVRFAHLITVIPLVGNTP